jgi:hypothetical protein
MSEQTQSYLTDDDNDEDERTISLKRTQIRSLEQRAKAASANEARAAKAERELALLKSGIDLSSPMGSKFVQHYDGDTTAEAVRAAAVEWGLAPASGNEHAAELQASQRVADAAAGGGGDREIDLYVAMKEARDAGKGQDEILRIARLGGMHVVGDDD